MYKQITEKCKHGMALLSLIIMPTTLFVVSLPQIVDASTTADYRSSCKYFTANNILQADTTCNIKFTTLGVSGGARFILYFPDGSIVLVFAPQNGKARANNIPSQVAIAGGNVLVGTDEGEIFIFKTYTRN